MDIKFQEEVRERLALLEALSRKVINLLEKEEEHRIKRRNPNTRKYAKQKILHPPIRNEY